MTDNMLKNFRRMKKEIRQDEVGFNLKLCTKDNWLKDSVKMVSGTHLLNSEDDIKEFSVQAINVLLLKKDYDLHEIKDYDGVLQHFITEVYRIKLELAHKVMTV